MAEFTLGNRIASHLGRVFIAIFLLPLSAHEVAQAQTSNPADRNVFEEIIVTSQKRAQSLQDISAAVTAVGSDSIDARGITNIADIQNLVPSIRLQKESASTEIYIRGVGSTLDFPMIEPPNAYNINGVYIPREVSSATLVDIERLEVLPGPQGTLYGRGAIGGVINTITKRPSSDLETKVVLETGDYSLIRASITQNIPVSDSLLLRGSVSYLEHDGYLASGADSAEDLAFFLSMDFSPSDTFSAFVWTHIEDKGGFSANLLSKGTVGDIKSQAFPNGDPWDDRLLGSLASFATLGPIDARSKDWDAFIIGAEIVWDINDTTSLTYLPSYIDFDWNQEYWLTHKFGDFNEEIEQSTHELRFSYDNGGALTWLAGIYAYNIETAGQLFIQFGANELFPGAPVLWLDVSDIRHHELKGVAGFGELTYALSDRTRLIAGGRISSDEREANGFQPDIVVAPASDTDPIALFTGVAPATFANSADWDHVDWKIGIEIDASDESLLYATVQTGFQPGTFDVFPNSVTEESELLSFTAGAKNHFADGQLMLNNEVFYYIYDNLLTQAFNAATGGNFLTNADVIIYGDQLELALAPESMPNTQFRFSVGYLHARYDDFIVDALDAFNDTQLQNAPDWTTTLGIIHDWEFGSGAYLRADLTSRYESGYFGDFLHSSGLYQEGYTKTDIALTYHSSDGNWSVGLWARNLENQDVQAAAATANPITDPGPGAPFLEAPRTYGIRFIMNLAGT
jgi:iron complex outermembrane receptor protein